MAKGGRSSQLLKLFVQSERLPEIAYRADLTGEPDAMKVARPVRRGGVGKAVLNAARWPSTLREVF